MVRLLALFFSLFVSLHAADINASLVRSDDNVTIYETYLSRLKKLICSQ